jgi:pilus assembly protein CpaF
MTLLNIIASLIPTDERLVVIEGARAGLHLPHPNLVSLESQPAAREGGAALTVRDLVQMSAQMRAERILVAELNGPECYEILRLIDQGQDGTMMTIAAESAERGLEWLLLLIKLSYPDLPESYLWALIAHTIQLVVEQTRLPDGQRKVSSIAEVVPTSSGDFELRNVWSYRQTGATPEGKIIGEFRPGVASLTLKDRLSALGFQVPPSILPISLNDVRRRRELEQQESVALQTLAMQTGVQPAADARREKSPWGRFLSRFAGRKRR